MPDTPTYSSQNTEPLALSAEELEREAIALDQIFKSVVGEKEEAHEFTLTDIEDILKEADQIDLDSYYDQSTITPLDILLSQNKVDGAAASPAKKEEKTESEEEKAKRQQQEAEDKARANEAALALAEKEHELEEILSRIIDAPPSSRSRLPTPPILALSNLSPEQEIPPEVEQQQQLEMMEILTGEDNIKGIEYASEEAVDPQLLAKVELIRSQTQAPRPVITTNIAAIPEKKAEVTTKEVATKIEDDVTGDPYTIFDDVNDDQEAVVERAKRRRFKQKILAFVATSALAAITLGLYLHFEQKYKDQSIESVKALSDIAASFLHARVYENIVLEKDTGTAIVEKPALGSLDFIQNNLKHVLTYPYQMLSPINTPSGLKIEGYDLDIYFTHDLKNFAIIASPHRNFISLLLNKPGFAIDSSDFSIYQYGIDTNWKKSYSALNLNQEAVSWVSPEELTSLKNSSAVLPIAQLNQGDITLGYETPAALKEINPAAQHYIYNLPKYYSLFSVLAEKAAALGRKEFFSEDITMVRQISKNLSSLKDVVIYSGHGSSGAIQMYNGLHEFAMDSSFIFGYIETDPATQRISYYQLLKAEDAQAANQMLLSNSDNSKSSTELIGNIHFLSPLRSAIQQRKAILDEIQREIQSLEANPPAEFETIYQNFTNRYTTANKTALANIQKIIASIYVNNTNDQQRVELYKLIKQNELESAIPSEIAEELSTFIKQHALEQILSEEALKHFSGIISQIQSCTRFEEIEVCITSFKDSLNERRSHINVVQEEELTRQLQSEVLNRVGTLILSKESAKNSATFQEYNRIILERLLVYVGLSPQEEVHYYIEEFDRLIEAINKFPSSEEIKKFQFVENTLLKGIESDEFLSPEQKKTAIELKQNSLNRLGEKLEEVKELETRIHQIPLNSLPSISPSEQHALSARKAQQMIYVQNYNSSSLAREEELTTAIELLTPLVNEALGLWKDILEARYQLIKLKEGKILELLSSGLGFTAHEEGLFPLIKSSLEKYQQEKQKLSTTPTYSDQYPARFKVFKKNQTPNIYLIKDKIDLIKARSNALLTAVSSYKLEIERYLDSYLQSQDQGYFSTNYQLHTSTLSRTRLALRQASNIYIDLETASHRIETTCSKYLEIITGELDSLEKETPITSNNPAKLLQDINNISSPNLFKENFGKRLKTLFEAPLNPNSKDN
jgi:hypothetical protein